MRQPNGGQRGQHPHVRATSAIRGDGNEQPRPRRRPGGIIGANLIDAARECTRQWPGEREPVAATLLECDNGLIDLAEGAARRSGPPAVRRRDVAVGESIGEHGATALGTHDAVSSRDPSVEGHVVGGADETSAVSDRLAELARESPLGGATGRALGKLPRARTRRPWKGPDRADRAPPGPHRRLVHRGNIGRVRPTSASFKRRGNHHAARRGAASPSDVRAAGLPDQRHDLRREPLHLLKLRTGLQQQQIQARIGERTHAVGDLFGRADQSRPQATVRD